MPFLHSCTQKSTKEYYFEENFTLAIAFYYIPIYILFFISLTAKNKLNLENGRMLEWHKKRLTLS